jgi:hypothetical protein
MTQCQVLLAEIYFDFTCQDLPPDILPKSFSGLGSESSLLGVLKDRVVR